ncbi:MAG: type II toxin-antitoxin system Phd/YefM family antitoxin [Pusillimonas sp.]
MKTTKVGIREFRAGLSEYIAAGTPVAVTRHGQTVGYFIPARGHDAAQMAALRIASELLDALLEKHGVNEDDVVAEFKEARKRAPSV